MLRPLLAASAVLLASCSQPMPETTEPPPEAVASGTQCAPAAGAPAPAGPEVPDDEARRVLAGLGATYAAADVANGRVVFARCKSCHTLAHAGPNTAGPNLWGLIGARVGTKEGFTYSKALQDADFVWGAANLDPWLANPKAFLPGNKMSFAGLTDQVDRRDLIAYIAVQAQAAPAH